MAEQNNNQEKKILIPEVISAAAAASLEEEEKKAVTLITTVPPPEEEEKKIVPPKNLDQSRSNIPIDNLETDELLELLEKTTQGMNLADKYKKLLKNGVMTGKFKSAATMVSTVLRKNQEYAAAHKLDDMVPLFEPHQFWDSQPVPKPSEAPRLTDNDMDKPIEEKSVEDVRQEPYPLSAPYFWDNLDMSDDNVIEEVYQLLLQNYVEDDDAMFRFDYSKEFLKWALLPPGYKPEWLIGVRGGAQRKLYGCITGIPVNMRLRGQEVQCAEINFLCVHKKLRAKRLAPVLIKEVTRRVNMHNIW